jgi:hypothetical protein
MAIETMGIYSKMPTPIANYLSMQIANNMATEL